MYLVNFLPFIMHIGYSYMYLENLYVNLVLLVHIRYTNKVIVHVSNISHSTCILFCSVDKVEHIDGLYSLVI